MDSERSRHGQCQLKGFTLVELLVVIGIIAVLISILLPALNRARAQAKCIACQSNIRQILLGTQLYVNDFHSVFPDGRNFSNETSAYIPRMDRYLDNNTDDYIQDRLSKYLHYQLAPATGVNPVWLCPALTGNQAANPWMNYTGATNYRYNLWYAYNSPGSIVKDSTKAMLFFDQVWEKNWTYQQYPHYSNNAIQACINVGYVDGHVESHTYNELHKGSYMPGHAGLYPTDQWDTGTKFVPTNATFSSLTYLSVSTTGGYLYEYQTPLYSNGYGTPH